MRCRSVASGTASLTQSVMQSTTQSIAAAQHNAVIRVNDEASNVIETHEHMGEFDVMLTYAWGFSASRSIGTPSHFAASLRSWNTRTLIEEPRVSKASNRA
jgi:hypothetical protein